MVVDTSALLAVIFQESHGQWVANQLQQNHAYLLMSSVNYAEVLILTQSKQPTVAAQIREALDLSSIQIVPPSAGQAEVAAWARLHFPLNLGDCFAYALAKHEDCPILALDRDFRNIDVKVVLPKRVF